MVARVGNKVTSPVPYKKNPNPGKDGPGYLPDEPHIQLAGENVHDDPPPKVVQTGVVRGGTTNPPEGESGSPEVASTEGDPHGVDTKPDSEMKDGIRVSTAAKGDDRPADEGKKGKK